MRDENRICLTEAQFPRSLGNNGMENNAAKPADLGVVIVGSTFDVFLSHNSKDKAAVRELKQRLSHASLRVWLDEDELRPGIPWQELLEAGIRDSRSVAVLVGFDGLGPWEDEEMQAALRLAVKDKRPVIPLLLPGAPAQPELPLFLGNRTWVDLRSGYSAGALNNLIWGITGQKPGQSTSSELQPTIPVPQVASPLPKALDGLLEVGSKFFADADLRNQSTRYKSILEEECSRMQILGMEQPVPLDDIYTEVRIVNRVKARMFKTLEELHAEAREAIERRGLATIQKAVREELEQAVKGTRLHARITEIELSFDKLMADLNLAQAKEALDLELEHPQFLTPADSIAWISQAYDQASQACTDVEQGLNTLKETFGRTLNELKSDERANEEPGSDTAAIRDQTKLEYEQERHKLEAKREASLASLAPLEHAYRSIIEKYERNGAELIAKKRKKLQDARQEENARDLSPEESQAILDGFANALANKIEEETRRKLTETIFNDFGHAPTHDGEPVLASEALKGRSKSLVLGQPGAGKTTLLKHIALSYLRSTADDARLPILITLRALDASREAQIFDYILRLFESCGFTNAAAFVERILQSKHECVLLFDGLDEVAVEKQADIVHQIVGFCKRFPRNEFVVSCRTANYRGQLEGFSEFEVAEFGSEQVATFVRGWFKDNANRAKDFLVEIRHHSGLQELTATPLLLALLCIGYRRNQRFPDQKALVYLASVDALIVDWDSSKQIKRHSFVQKFDPESKKHLLSKFACDTFCEESLFFTHDEVIERFESYTDVYPIPRKSGDGILTEFVENHGLLVERAKGIYSFSHLTIQEFLSALHLSRSQPTSVLERLAEAAWHDGRWKEVVVFLGGLLPRSDLFLVCLRNRMKRDLASSRIRDFLLGESLPEPGETYLTSERAQSDPQGWRAWISWRMFLYRLQSASPDSVVADRALVMELSTQAGNLGVETSIARAMRLGQGMRHDLVVDRPLNMAVSASIAELPPVSQASLVGEREIIGKFILTAAMIAEILASGARCSPDLRRDLLLDLSRASHAAWPYPVLSKLNKLGA